MRGITLRGGLAAVAATAILTAPLAVPAGAGGGCHEPLTEGEGNTVAMRKACFGPSILTVDPGAEVTFLNRDAVVHNVGGNGWGLYADMNPGDAFTASFREEGIYPFACSYHPGMVGAVVVGDATGAGSGSSVMGPSAVTQAETVGEEDGAASTSADAGTSPTGWVAGGVLGMAIGGGLGLAWRRRGRAGNASS